MLTAVPDVILSALSREHWYSIVMPYEEGMR